MKSDSSHSGEVLCLSSLHLNSTIEQRKWQGFLGKLARCFIFETSLCYKAAKMKQ
jgi:hypothetical protein